MGGAEQVKAKVEGEGEVQFRWTAFVRRWSKRRRWAAGCALQLESGVWCFNLLECWSTRARSFFSNTSSFDPFNPSRRLRCTRA